MKTAADLKKINHIITIPSEWETKRLSEVADFITKGTTPTTYGYKWMNTGIPFFKSDCIKEGKFVYGDFQYISEEAHNSLNRSKIKFGDMLISITGDIGKVAMVPESIDDGNINQHVARIRINNKATDRDFVYHWMNQKQVQDYFNLIKTGLAYPQISLQQVRDTLIPIPPIQEQHEIASILTTWDKVIELKEKLLFQKKEQLKGLIQRLMTGESRMPGFIEKWEETTLGKIGIFLKGKGITKAQTLEQGTNCIRYGEIYTSHHFYIKKFYSFIPKEVAKNSTKIEMNDILFAGSGETVEEIGKAVAYLDEHEAYAGGDIIILRPTIKIDSLFLSFLINTGEVAKERSKLGQGNSVVHIYHSNLSNLKVHLPSFEEQQEIAKLLKTFDDNLELLQKEILEITEQKKGLMQLLLTGKVRVKV